ncbi:MAG: hypothetical protein FGM52_05105 [Mycobacterium sp.]|nr:hypothetical protein [Mycobacterium sp.]
MSREHHFNQLREAVAEHFATKPPADVVPHEGLTRDALLGLNLLAGSGRLVTVQDGALRVDGNTVAVSGPEVYTDHVSAPVVTRAAVERAGLTPADVPNLWVVD